MAPHRQIIFIHQYGGITYGLYQDDRYQGFIFMISEFDGKDTRLNIFGVQHEEFARNIASYVRDDTKKLHDLYSKMCKAKGIKPKDLGHLKGDEVGIEELFAMLPDAPQANSCCQQKN